MEAKQHATKQQRGQEKNQRRNKKIPGNKKRGIVIQNLQDEAKSISMEKFIGKIKYTKNEEKSLKK